MFKKKNCFCSKKEIGVLDRNNQLFAEENVDVLNKNNQSFSVKDNRSCVIVDLLSSAIIRHEMRLRSKEERIINKNNEERTGLLRTVGQNRERFINDYNKETI
jgi:hypothetical protein